MGRKNGGGEGVEGGACNCASHVRLSDWSHCAFPVSGVDINRGKISKGLNINWDIFSQTGPWFILYEGL